MRIPAIFAALATLMLSAVSADTATDSELVMLISLSRHGSRAPNPTVKAHCPNNLPNIQSYSMEKVGDHIREVYVNEKGFLSPIFNGPEDDPHFEGYFRADTANRCCQSAVAMGYGLYPEGTGPDGYPRQPIPVYMSIIRE
ncbi:Histidine phosphatase superfamily [Phytophthora cactorum]|nr:Histidine phosphatase superfamily [Phytophthora cactorum]